MSYRKRPLGAKGASPKVAPLDFSISSIPKPIKSVAIQSDISLEDQTMSHRSLKAQAKHLLHKAASIFTSKRPAKRPESNPPNSASQENLLPPARHRSDTQTTLHRPPQDRGSPASQTRPEDRIVAALALGGSASPKSHPRRV